MKRLAVGLSALVTGLAIAPNLALALSAVTTESTNLRAGPAFDFPVVDSIPSDVRVNVHGCLRAYRWCDVSWRDARGWVPGDELAYLYDGRRVTIVEYGPRIGLPVVAFSFDTYWDRHYRDRSWYGERGRWRTVWREHGKGSAHNGDRPQRGIEKRTERPQAERTDRGGRNERPQVRTERGDWRDRGETRGYNPQPQVNPAPHRELNRGMHQGGGNPDGRAERSTPDHGREGKSAPNGGGHGQGEHRPN